MSLNPECRLQAYMAVQRVNEREFYRSITGQEYPGEYGERVSARRRGQMFERNLHRDNAQLLRESVAPLFGYDAATMTVRNLDEEAKAAGERGRTARLPRTRAILTDLAAGREVPQLVIQPQFRLRLGLPGMEDYVISPDFMVFDPRTEMYVVGEEKSQILREGVGEPIDLDRARRQAGVEIIALRAEAARSGLDARVEARAVLIFASPFGLQPARAAEERNMSAEVYEIERALRVIREVAAEFADYAVMGDGVPQSAIEALPINYRESCIKSCLMAGYCQRRCAGQARLLGESAAEFFGPEMPIERIIELCNGAEPVDERERRIVEEYRSVIEVLTPGRMGGADDR